jgi:hypothetical protein
MVTDLNNTHSVSITAVRKLLHCGEQYLFILTTIYAIYRLNAKILNEKYPERGSVLETACVLYRDKWRKELHFF